MGLGKSQIGMSTCKALLQKTRRPDDYGDRTSVEPTTLLCRHSKYSQTSRQDQQLQECQDKGPIVSTGLEVRPRFNALLVGVF